MGRHEVVYPERNLPGAWVKDAACKTAPPAWFYPRFGAKRAGEKRKEAAAKTMCNSCPVQETCLDWALENEEEDGVWGGLNPKERLEFLDKKERQYA